MPNNYLLCLLILWVGSSSFCYSQVEIFGSPNPPSSSPSTPSVQTEVDSHYKATSKKLQVTLKADTVKQEEITIVIGDSPWKPSIRINGGNEKEEEEGKGHRRGRKLEPFMMMGPRLRVGINTFFNEPVSNTAVLNADPLRESLEPSLNWDLSVLRQRISLHKNRWNIEYGVGWEWNVFNLGERLTLLPENDSRRFVLDSHVYKKNKLMTQYVKAPISFVYEGWPHKRRKSFHAELGVYGAYLMQATRRTKLLGESLQKLKDQFFLKRINYGVVGSFGVGPFVIYGEYQLNEMFDEPHQPIINPFTVGISLIGF